MTERKLNYDPSQLQIMTDQGGFILGQSILGVDKIRTAANRWVDKTAGWSNININRSVEVDQGFLFRPQTGVLTLITNDPSWLESQGREIQILYRTALLFDAVVSDASASYQINANTRKPEWIVTVTATDQVDYANNANFQSYPVNPALVTPQDALVDVQNLVPGVNIEVLGGNIGSNARGYDGTNNTYDSAVSAMQIINDVSDSQLCICFSGVDYNIHLVDADQISAFGPELAVSDMPDDGTLASNYEKYGTYTNVSFNQATDYIVTSAIAQTKAETGGVPNATATANIPNPQLHVSQAYTVPVTTGAISTWVNDLPLLSATQPLPSVVDMPFQETLFANDQGQDLCNLIDIYADGVKYPSAISSLTHDIPSDGCWSIELGLFPASIITQIGSDSVPNPVSKLTATVLSTTSVQLNWSPPIGGSGVVLSNYVIRRATGLVAPITPTSGTSVGTVSIGSATTINATGLTPGTTYSFGVFSNTTTSGVFGVSTITITTPQSIPNTLSLSHTLVGSSSTTLRETWAKPSNTGWKLRYYLVLWNVTSSGTANYPSRNDANITGGLITTNLNNDLFTVDSTKHYWISVYTITTDGQFSAVAHDTWP